MRDLLIVQKSIFLLFNILIRRDSSSYYKLHERHILTFLLFPQTTYTLLLGFLANTLTHRDKDRETES